MFDFIDKLLAHAGVGLRIAIWSVVWMLFTPIAIIVWAFAPWQIGVVGWGLWLLYGYISAKKYGIIDLFRDAPESAITDIYDHQNRLSAMLKPYDVNEWIEPGKVFIGLSEGNKKGRIPLSGTPELFHKNHVGIIGASGVGKTKISALILTQLMESGDAVVVADPKDDDFLAGILHSAADRLGRPSFFVNLRSDVPQINPFYKASQDEKELLLEAALGLEKTGNAAVDYHRGEDRDANAELVGTGASHILSLVATGAEMKTVTSRQNFWRELKDLSRVKAFHTEEGIDIESVLDAGGLVYIVGDTDSLRIQAAQRLLIARVFQIIKNRKISASTKQVNVMLDEFKYVLSNTVLRALGTIRSKRCNLHLAFQSYGDLADCGGLPKEAVLGAAEGNTTLKFVFKIEDVGTAEKLCIMAGKEKYIAENTGKVTDEDGRETGSFRLDKKEFLEEDMLTTNMPKPLAGQASVCWLFGDGPPKLLSVMHLPAGVQPEIRAAEPLPQLPPKLLDAQASIALESAAETLQLDAPAAQIQAPKSNAQELI
jgi:hypothetical protein